MQGQVFSGRHDSEVFRCVVVFVLVQVMDMLVTAQGPSQHVLRNNTVLMTAEELSVSRWLDGLKAIELRLAVFGPANLMRRHVRGITPSAKPLRMHAAVAKTTFFSRLLAALVSAPLGWLGCAAHS
jgi:hypothetical protein